jgi:hypothetical protein
LGYGFSTEQVNIALNGYYTQWMDKSLRRIACKDRVEERRAGKISCIDKYIVVVIELIVKTTLHAPRQEILKTGHSVQFIRTRGRVS